MCSPRWILAAMALLLSTTGRGRAQSVDVGGRAYVDYFYALAAADEASEDLHGFRYRRLYLTTDFTLSGDVTGRARLEANDGTVGPNGPVPIVKDLWLRWAYHGAHRVTLGVTSPPAFGIAQDVWGYRSLNRTVLDQQGLVGSRDFGLRLDGPVAGTETVRYAVMVANNSGLRSESNKHKRIYSQLALRPTDRLRFVVGGDYASYGGQRDHSARLSAFAGYSTAPLHVGLEGYWARTRMRDGGTRTNVGASLFGGAQVAPRWELVARVDRSRIAGPGPDAYDTLLIGALAYRPHPNVRLIPNLRARDRTDAPAETTARFTVEVHF
ncbi:MAG: hypothetical protein ABEL97_03690 [Salinibacter sp.]